jgi:UDP-galactose transporter
MGWLESIQRTLLFGVGAVCYALLGILSQLSKAEDGTYAYSMPTVITSAEAVKLLLSFRLLCVEVQSVSKAVQSVAGTTWSSWLACSVPSFFYAIGNNLDMLNNQYMDPATEQVLVQLKTLTTGVVWWLVFREPLGVRKWSAIMLLCAGGIAGGWQKAEVGKKTMYIEAFGILLVSVHCTVSACAGVYNEWIYKNGHSKTDSIHLTNIRLYIIGVTFNFAMYASSSTTNPFSATTFFQGYNAYTWSLVLVYAVMGLLLAQVMRFFNVIVKLFISGSSMYVSAILSYVLFGYMPTPMFLLALSLITVAILLYNLEKIQKLRAD